MKALGRIILIVGVGLILIALFTNPNSSELTPRVKVEYYLDECSCYRQQNAFILSAFKCRGEQFSFEVKESGVQKDSRMHKSTWIGLFGNHFLIEDNGRVIR